MLLDALVKIYNTLFGLFLSVVFAHTERVMVCVGASNENLSITKLYTIILMKSMQHDWVECVVCVCVRT